MDYVRLGRAGLKVSRICLGTMTFGREADEAGSFQLLDYFLDQGGTFVDTADAYSTGASEEIIGRWLASRGGRARIVLATKVFGEMGRGPNDGGLSRLHIQQAVEASIKRLRTDVIDLYQLHRWDAYCPVEETLSALSDLVRQGKVRYIGISNVQAWQLAKYRLAAQAGGWEPFVSLQPVYNALSRAIEHELLPLCADAGLGVLSYNPLAGGMLTGKYLRGQPMPTGARLEAFKFYHERYYTDEALTLVEQFVAAATARGVTPAQLALGWVLAEPRITCPIVGARNVGQLKDTLGGLALRLTSEERAAIPAAPPGRWVGVDPVYDA